MGIIYWFVNTFSVCLLFKLGLYIFKVKVAKLPKSSKLKKYIQIEKNFSQSVYVYLAVNQIITVTCLTLFMLSEYINKAQLTTKDFLSDYTISRTSLVRLDLLVAVNLLIGLIFHFCRILVMLHWKEWFGFQAHLNKIRGSYASQHRRLMRSGFGRGYDFDIKRLRVDKVQYLMVKLE